MKRYHHIFFVNIISFLLIVDCILPTCLLSQGVWTQKADFGGGNRQQAVGFSIGTKGYIGIGLDGVFVSDFWEWDQATNLWTQKANFIGTIRNESVGFSIGTKGYISTGGNSSPVFYKECWEWDQTTNIWTQKADFGGTARWQAVGFSIGTKGYIATGDTDGGDNGPKKDFWEWDQANNTWTQKTNFGGIERYDGVGFSIGTKGYIGTGYYSITNTFLNDFWEWDQATNLWTQKANFIGTIRGEAKGFSIGTKGYIGTGIDNNGNLLKDFWEWDQTTNTWTQKANFGGTAREDAVSFSIGSKGYIGTGADPSTTKDFWEYTPDSTVGINEITLKNSITVFPNPTAGKFTVQTQNVKITSLEIYNVLGKMVYSKQPHSQQLNEIDISKEPEGVYFVRVYTELGMLSKKVLLVK